MEGCIFYYQCRPKGSFEHFFVRLSISEFCFYSVFTTFAISVVIWCCDHESCSA